MHYGHSWKGLTLQQESEYHNKIPSPDSCPNEDLIHGMHCLFKRLLELLLQSGYLAFLGLQSLGMGLLFLLKSFFSLFCAAVNRIGGLLMSSLFRLEGGLQLSTTGKFHIIISIIITTRVHSHTSRIIIVIINFS